MTLMIPSNIMDTLTCSRCFKFLSVIPVKVLPNKKIICGRCVTDEDEGIVSNYNILLEKSKFKCVNRFDGCEELISAADVLKHEEICEANYYNCPICTEDVPTYLMINHFEDNHKDSYLTVSNFLIDNIREAEKNFLYRHEDYLFFIHFTCKQPTRLDNIHVTINISFIGTSDMAFVIRSKFTIFFGRSRVDERILCEKYPSSNTTKELDIISDDAFYSLSILFAIELQKPIMCTSLKFLSVKSTESGLFLDQIKMMYFKSRDIYLNDVLKKSFPDATVKKGSRLYLTIDNNEVYVSLKCLMCSVLSFYIIVKLKGINQYSVLCENCFIAQKWSDMKFLYANNLKDIFLFCKWNCGVYKHPMGNDNIFYHEHSCEKQLPQKCPIDVCEYYIKLHEAPSHFTKHHPKIQFFKGAGIATELNVSLSPLKIAINRLTCYIVVTCTWKRHFWEVSLNCNLPNVKPRAIVLDEDKQFLNFIKGTGSIPPMNIIYLVCYIQNPESAEYEKTICTKIYSN